jgi:hypothetical protein
MNSLTTRSLAPRLGRRTAWIAFDPDTTAPPVSAWEAVFCGPTPRRLVVIDLRSCQSIAPAGLEWIERVVALGEATGARTRLVAPDGSRARRVLELTRFDRFARVVEQPTDALRRGYRLLPLAPGA